ncbi:hypothetical protein [Methanosarcina barkeri]|uniref:Uncharacterized protein n=1 Tax=Methanosarcina barkeri 227 TaxID=1434106 RepID=A0A0E3LPN9_METBA|nr:hypothetical protein [Methanosarcina barkeri]AKB56851.1 hypothetical protein MSBR2_0335 [Methanosarcina barkeri 227]
MNESAQNITEQEKEALKFLEQDFNQCFQQMRYYDSQIFEILKFMFTSYSILISVSIGLYQFGITQQINLTHPLIAAISIGLIFGTFMFLTAIRNRVYFVHVARYVNEQRNFFLKFKPMGFENKCEMYTNHEQPPHYNWKSSQFLLCGIISTFNSILFSILLYFIYPGAWNIVILGFLVLFSMQLISAAIYLKSKENKSASKSIFGKE